MIRIITVGHCSYTQFSEYLKRCKNIKHVMVKEVKNKNDQVVKEKESEQLFSKAKGFVVVLSEEGKQLSSKEFSCLLQEKPEISFLVGGARGVSEQLKQQADLVLSLSSLTFPHDLAQVLLAEQVYRAQKINEGHPYHKE